MLLGCTFAALAVCILVIPFLVSGSRVWVGVDWIDGRKLLSIDDAYRYFAAKNAFRLPSLFLWNYTMPVALLFDSLLSLLSGGGLVAMRCAHAGVGVLTLAAVARCSLRAGCHPLLAAGSLLIVGLMPLYLVLSSSFYGEGLLGLGLVAALLWLIEGKYTLLALSAGLLPLIRPEGTICSVLCLVYFGLRRDVRRASLTVVPGIAYLLALLLGPVDLASSLSWRVELRKILIPSLSQGPSEGLSVASPLNPAWCGLALSALFLARYRKWWPVLLAPWVLIVVYGGSVWYGAQDYELRYLFSVIPVFGVAWALPLQEVARRSAGSAWRRGAVGLLAALVCLGTVGDHLRQADWLRRGAGQPRASARALSPSGNGALPQGRELLFDPEPLRAFCGRAESYLRTHPGIRTVFVSDSTPLYFLDFLGQEPRREVVLIPHNAALAAFSGGYHFGFDLTRLRYGYYGFYPVERGRSATGLYIGENSGAGPFPPGEASRGEGEAALLQDGEDPLVPRLASDRMEAYAVGYTRRDSARWVFPSPGGR